MTGETLACPSCDATNIKRRLPGVHTGSPAVGDELWRCYDCGERFDEPIRRRRQSRGDGRSGLARDLADADPEEVAR